jgi:hypothetical protein
LVLFAGPHHAASSSVQEFFYHYAAKHTRKGRETFGLRKWRWPHFNGTLLRDHPRPYQVMENLVTLSTDEAMQAELLEGIQEAWDETTDGMILGTPEFDRSAGGHVEGLEAMKRIVDHLQVNADDVTVVLNYRTPRIDHWLSMWWRERKAMLEQPGKKSHKHNITYQEYMCNPNAYIRKEEIMATAMNPMEIAQTVVQEGWKVVLMDLAGIEAAGRDVATVIACDVLYAACDDGFLRNHAEHPYHETDPILVEDSKLKPQDVDLAEQVLLARDCYYERTLRYEDKDNAVEVFHNTSVWKTCDPAMKNIYAQLKESGILFRSLLSQMDCGRNSLPEHMVTADQALNGDIPRTEKGWSTQKERNKSKGGGGGGFLEAILFPMILLAVGGFQVYKMHTSRVANNAKTTEALREAEMSELGGSNNNNNNNGNGGGFSDDAGLGGGSNNNNNGNVGGFSDDPKVV